METWEQRLQIRQMCQEGRAAGELFSIITQSEDRARLEIDTARALIHNEGTEDYSYYQGVWHVIGVTPLCFIRQTIEKGLSE
jgi:hypothetical protein